MWRENNSDLAKAAPFEASAAGEAFYLKLQELSPQNDSQRSLQARAIQLSTDIAQTRLQLFAQMGNSIPMPFLVVLIFWLTIVFASFGLFAPANPTVIVALFLCSVAVSGGIYLIEELDNPLSGFIQVPSDSMRKALVEITH